MHLTRSFFLIAFLFTQALVISGQDRAVDLKPGNLTSFQVESRMEVKGTLFLDPTTETRSVSMDVKANYRYGERLAIKPGIIKSVRYYENAESKIQLATGTTQVNLQPENHYLILERKSNVHDGKRIRFQSPQPKLTELEFSLVNVQGNTMLLSQWLQASNKKMDESWTTENDLLADVLTWDLIEDNQIQAKLMGISGQEARIQLSGRAKGIVDGAACEASVQGTCTFNLAEGYVSRIQLKISENRDAGLVAPGFEANIWLENNIAPTNQTRLTNAALNELKMSPFSRADQFFVDAECGPYEMLYQRHWRLIGNRSDRVVLRCIRDGIVLAQCDIVPMSNQPADMPVSLEQFKMTVKKAVMNNGGDVIDSKQSPSLSQRKWMRVDATGKSNDIPMRWIYCTVTSPDLRRVQLLFTLEEDAYREFVGFEQELIDAIEFQSAVAKTGESSKP